jgi:hypothetical protein
METESVAFVSVHRHLWQCLTNDSVIPSGVRL